IDPLPDDDNPTWEQVNQVVIEEGSGGGPGGGFGFGPRGIPGMPQIPRPPFGPFGPGMPGMPGRFQDRTTTTRRGDERTTYTREDGAGDAVTIRKTYELKVPPAAGRTTSLTLTGNGVIAFDSKKGLPQTVDFTATLNIISGNTNTRFPLTVSYKLVAPPAPGTPTSPPAAA